MVQSGKLQSRKVQSKGSARKHVGVTAKHKHHNNQGRNKIRDKATAAYVKTIEGQMASRLPSDQRDKLTVVHSTGPAPTKKKGLKKPLTRGRSRGDKKKKKK